MFWQMFCQKSKWPCFSHTRVTQLQPRITPSCGRPTTRREAKPLQYHPFYRYRPTEPGDDAANIRVGTRFAKNVQKLGQHPIRRLLFQIFRFWEFSLIFRTSIGMQSLIFLSLIRYFMTSDLHLCFHGRFTVETIPSRVSGSRFRNPR